MRRDTINLTGRRFGRLVALNPVRDKQGKLTWLCDCGREAAVSGGNLRQGRLDDTLRGGTKSCGCLAHQVRVLTKFKHGLIGIPEYGIFNTIKQRCGNPKSAKWWRYGGTGIECRFRDFEHFFATLGPHPSPRHSVDRKDTLGHYEPSNVRWATAKEQRANRRPNPRALSREDIFGLLQSPLAFGC